MQKSLINFEQNGGCGQKMFYSNTSKIILFDFYSRTAQQAERAAMAEVEIWRTRYEIFSKTNSIGGITQAKSYLEMSLRKLLADKGITNDAIGQWIDENVPEEESFSNAFIYTLTRVLTESQIGTYVESTEVNFV